MPRKLFYILLFLVASLNLSAQNSLVDDTLGTHWDSSRLRISLLTCGAGNNEVWEVFGHTGVRIIDSNQHTDWVYNYGTFEFSDDFEIQFAKGKLLYSLSVAPFSDFMPEYVEAGRSVQEQVFLLNNIQKAAIQNFLEYNALPANRKYKYDFFLDNCATRIRDIFPAILGHDFKYNEVRPTSHPTFRNIMNEYFYYKHWERVGVNILLGSRIDKVMTNENIMFLPDYLRDGLAAASLNNKPLTTAPITLLQGSEHKPAPLNQPFVVTFIILLLTISGIFIKPLRILGTVMRVLLMLTTGLLGCIIIVMWLGTDHQACANNFNIFWALPTNLLLIFTRAKGKGRYALVAMGLILIVLILHIVKIQQVTLFELSPIFIALLLVYYDIYRRSVAKVAAKLS